MRYEHGRIDRVILGISFLSQMICTICHIFAEMIEVQHENTYLIQFLSILSCGVVSRQGPNKSNQPHRKTGPIEKSRADTT